MSELAAEAQIARGTLYRVVDSVDELYGKVVDTVAGTIHTRVAAAMDDFGASDPALRLATGLRLFVRLVHDDPATGRFIVRFGLTEESLQALLTGPPMRDIENGIEAGRYDITPNMKLAVAGLVAGSTVSAMQLVLEGHLGWRDAGSTTAELVLRALGISAAEARAVAEFALPPLKLN
jgi:AcrR family transcriptional regulator